MHFGVCFFCVLLASESFVKAMPRPSVLDRNVLQIQQTKDQNSEDFYVTPRIIPSEVKIQEGFQNEGNDNSYKSLKVTNNARNSPTFDNYGSPNEAVRDDSASFSSFYLERPGRRNIRKMEDYSSDYKNAFMQGESINKLIAPVNTFREPHIPMNIPPVLPAEIVQPFGNKLRKPSDEDQNTLNERKWEGRQGRTSVDEVGPGFIPQETSQLNYQKGAEHHHLDDEEQERGPLQIKQRNTAAFWRKRGMPVLAYDTSGMLGEPEEDSLLQNDMLYGLESSTQNFFIPNPHDVSYGTGRNTNSDMGSINSPIVNEDDEYQNVPNLPSNSLHGNVAVQNYQQNVEPFQLSRAYDHNYQPLSSLTNTANEFPSNSYLTANSYKSESVPGLPAGSSGYPASPSDEDAMSFNRYLTENNNVGFNSQMVLPHEEELKYPTENQDKDYKNKYSYNDEMSNAPNQNEKDIYPGLFRHNSYVGDNVVPGLSDSFPNEQLEREKQIDYNNYKKTKYIINNQSPYAYSSSKEFGEKYVVGDNRIDNSKGYYSDVAPNSVEQSYSYDYPGTLRETPDREKYMGVSSQLLHNPVINSYALPPMDSVSHSKSDQSSNFNKHFTSDLRPVITGSHTPRKWQYELQKNMRKNLLERYKKPRQFVSVRNKQIMPYVQDNAYAEFHPRYYRTQDPMNEYNYTDSDSDNKNQININKQWELQQGSQIPHAVVSNTMTDSNYAANKQWELQQGSQIPHAVVSNSMTDSNYSTNKQWELQQGSQIPHAVVSNSMTDSNYSTNKQWELQQGSQIPHAVVSDSMTDSNCDNKNQINIERQSKLQQGSQIPHIALSESLKGLKKHCIEEAEALENKLRQQKGEAETFDVVSDIASVFNPIAFN